MTLDEVKAKVDDIRKKIVNADYLDNEKIHIAEDSLHQSVLRAIAQGKCEDPKGCAKEALKTRRFDYTRWYA